MSPGFLGLYSAGDLLAKLRHDRERLEINPLDQFAAFDFFVTAWHMVDWTAHSANSRDERKRRKVLLRSGMLMKICGEIANGSKHYLETRDPDSTVDRTGVRHGAFSRGFSIDFDISIMFIYLKPDVLAALSNELDASLQNPLDVVDLSAHVLRFWESQMPAFPDAAPTARVEGPIEARDALVRVRGVEAAGNIGAVGNGRDAR